MVELFVRLEAAKSALRRALEGDLGQAERFLAMEAIIGDALETDLLSAEFPAGRIYHCSGVAPDSLLVTHIHVQPDEAHVGFIVGQKYQLGLTEHLPASVLRAMPLALRVPARQHYSLVISSSPSPGTAVVFGVHSPWEFP